MKKEKILVAFDTLEEGFEELEEKFELIRPPKGKDFTMDELKALIPDCVALCSVFDIPVPKELIAEGKQLKLIANYAVGYNNIDLEFASQKGIAVANTPKSVVAPTAELAMALLLSLSRRVAEWDQTIRKKGRDLRPSRLDCLGLDVYGKKIAIIGFGAIGRAIATRCKAFGMEVLYNKRNRLTEEEEKALGITYLDLDEIFKVADIVSLNMPYNKDSHHLVNAKRLQEMSSHSLLINTARGSVVDENALVEALQKGEIAGAALDVFEDADRPDPRLLEMPNVVMTPHIGTQTYDARLSMIREMSDNILGFFFSDRPVSLVKI